MMFKKITTLLLWVTLVVFFVSGPSLAAGAETIVTREVSTEDEFHAALDDNSVNVIKLTQEISLSWNNLNGDNAFVIKRPVTITGGKLNLPYAGMILGADVVLENITLCFNNPVRNAIIANGYSLTIDTVTGEGSYEIDLFCGGITDYTGANPEEIPSAGSHGSITMKGTNTIGEKIYAGSLSDIGHQDEGGNWLADVPNNYDGKATITLEQGAGGFNAVYAHGARENRSGGYANEWISDAAKYTVSGDVTIRLNSSKVVTVNGSTGGAKNATFIYQDNGSGNLCQPNLSNIDSIILVAPEEDDDDISHLAPNTTQTEFNSISVPLNTRLSFTEMTNDIVVTSLNGGGEIVFSDCSQKLTIGTATGTTKVAVGGVDYTGEASTGAIEEDWNCITVTDTTSDCDFVLMPNSYNTNMLLEHSADETGGNWTTKLEECSLRVEEISIESTVEAEEDNGGIVIPVAVTYSTEDEYNFLGDIPMTITVNGEETVRTLSIGYDYSIVMADSEIVMYFEWSDYENEVNFWITDYNANDYSVPVGTYTISITIPGTNMESGQETTITTTVTVKSESTQPEPSDAKVAGYSLSLDGSIGVNFYMELSDALAADAEAYMLFTMPSGEQSMLVSEAQTKPSDDGKTTYYVFTCDVAAKEMTDCITAQMFYSNGNNGMTGGEEYTYSVREYAVSLMADNKATDLEKALVKAMLNYGAYAQVYFNYNTSNPANKDYEETMLEISKGTLSDYIPVVSENNDVLTYAGSSMRLESEIVVRHYFKLREDRNYTGELTLYVAPQQENMTDTYYYYESTGIPVAAWGEMTSYEDVEGIAISYSPLSYVTTVIANNTTDLAEDISLQNLMKALYRYYEAAVAYAKVAQY